MKPKYAKVGDDWMTLCRHWANFPSNTLSTITVVMMTVRRTMVKI